MIRKNIGKYLKLESLLNNPILNLKNFFTFFKDLNTLKETNELENILNIDPTMTAELNENINYPITKDEIFKGIKNL
jgi:hypothetical protein